MTRLTQNEFDQSTLEAMMERYRAELLRYQRATPPGRPTLEQNLKTAVLKNEEQPPEQDDIWEQPAIFAAEQPKDTEQEEIQQPAPLLLPEPAPPPEPEPERDIEPTSPQNISFDCYEFEKCIGAYGSFVPYEQAKSCCKAEIFNRPTDVMVKFAADIPPGAAESSRCRKSFWVRFFCGDKLYDLPASLLSAEVVDDALLSQAFSKSFCADPKTGLRDKANFWRVVTANPRSLSMAVRLYSDMGTIGSYRMADGFCHPLIWQNANGEQKLVKPRWLSAHRPRTLSRFEAEELAASDPMLSPVIW